MSKPDFSTRVLTLLRTGQFLTLTVASRWAETLLN
jgi:hypothetical protein